MDKRDIVISVREVEPGLVAACKKLSERLGRPLKGVVLIDKDFMNNLHRVKDSTGYFEELVCDFDNEDDLQQVIKSLDDRILTVTCRFETAIQDFRKLIPFLPYVNTPTETALLWSTEKRLMRDRLHGYDATLTPKYVPLTEYDQATVDEIVKDYDFPVIVKPNGLYASLLVERCDTLEQLHQCLEQTFVVIEEVYARENGAGKPSILIEEMMQGDMYSVDAYVSMTGEVYCLPPVQVITAHAIGLPGFYSYRHILPTQLSVDQIAGAHSTTEAAIKALNLGASTAHVELFLTPKGWKVIELGPRIGGYREGLYREAYEIDHYYNDLVTRIGLEPEIKTKPVKHAAGVNIYADEEGVITEISGTEEASRLSSVVFFGVHAKVGDRALFAGNGGTLIVDAILSNEDPEVLEADVRKLRELVHIEVNAIKPELLANF